MDLNLAHGDFSPFQKQPKSKFSHNKPFVIENITPHLLRHTFATLLYFAGVDILTAKEQNHLDSDIDLAVVSKVFTEDVCNNYALVNFLAFNVDTNIDAQAIIYEDWINKTPFTAEVEKQGVLIS